jgi:hypothetical protein
MRTPIYLRTLTDGEARALQEGLRSADAFVFRRGQILLASARGQHARESATLLGCDDQTVRNASHACTTRGLAALRRGASAPHRTPPAVFDPERRERLRTLLPQSPRTFGQPPGVWPLRLAADVARAEGLLPRPVSGDTMRPALAALKTRWRRANHWLTRPGRCPQTK